MAPLDVEQIAVELNIQNPLVVAMLGHWISVRRQRMAYCQSATQTIKQLQKELAEMQ